MEETPPAAKAAVYTRYPLAAILLYNGVTVLHFILGGIGIILAYNASGIAYVLGLLYLIFAFGQMYGIMPLLVCPNCIYFGLEDSLCVTGLNVFSRRIARPGQPENFAKRAQGPLCHNNLYMAALILPVVGIIPGLIANFALGLLVIWAAVIGLLLFRFFVIFGQIACLHCRAKYDCPNAERAGVRDR